MDVSTILELFNIVDIKSLQIISNYNALQQLFLYVSLSDPGDPEHQTKPSHTAKSLSRAKSECSLRQLPAQLRAYLILEMLAIAPSDPSYSCDRPRSQIFLALEHPQAQTRSGVLRYQIFPSAGTPRRATLALEHSETLRCHLLSCIGTNPEWVGVGPNKTKEKSCVNGIIPQQGKLMGSSAQISSGVRVPVYAQVPEVGSGRFQKVGSGRTRKVPEGSGEFRRVLV